MRTVIVGAVESTRVAMRAIAAAAGFEIAALVTLPRELAGRHSDFVDLGAEANALDIEVLRAADGNAPPIVDRMRQLEPDLVFVIGWSQICREAFLGAAPARVVGYHPAALPRLRGRGVIPWTILLGEAITAGTLFWIDGGVDSGPILAQRFFHVAPDETAASLYATHMDVLGEMMAEALPSLRAGTPRRQAQDERFATWAAKRTPADGLIDWRQPAADVWRLVRAVGQPYPGAFTWIDSDRLVIWEAGPWPGGERHSAMPGQVIARDDGTFTVCCGDGGGLHVTRWESAAGAAPRLHSRLGGN